MHRSPRAIAIAATAVAAALLATPTVDADSAPEYVSLNGKVRDFRERSVAGGHPDFEREPIFGFGHYAGVVGLELGSDGKPVFAGTGFKVKRPWRDAQGRSIAPHLGNARWSTSGEGAPEAVAPEEPVTVVLEDSKGRDAFEVTFRSVVFNDDGTSSWTYHVAEIPGPGRDLSHWNVKLDPTHEVMPGTTAGYDFGTDGSTGFFGIKWDVSDGFEEGEFTIVLDGHFRGVDDPEGVLAKGGNKSDTGAMFVPSTELAEPTGGSGTATLVTDPDLGDTEGLRDMADNGGIESAASFDQWFRDVPGLNLSAPFSITLVRQDDGTYLYDDEQDCRLAGDGGFFPIDGQLFGDSEASAHNFHFTYELHATFTYDASADQTFTFSGDDDVWVYVDGRLAIDNGGMHAELAQTVEMDRMGLVDGETYRLDFFFAERHRDQSNFRIETNVVLTGTSRSVLMSSAVD